MYFSCLASELHLAQPPSLLGIGVRFLQLRHLFCLEVVLNEEIDELHYLTK